MDSEINFDEYRVQWAQKKKLAVENMPQWIEAGMKYIYPQKAEEWKNSIESQVNTGFFDAIEPTLEFMQRLDEGESLESVIASLEQSGSIGILENLLSFSKRGPEVYEMYYKTHGVLYPNQEFKVKDIQSQNQAFEWIPQWIETGKKYIYPQKAEEWKKSVESQVNTGFYGAIEPTLEFMKRLDEGESLESVIASLEQSESMGVLENLLSFSKRGPEVYEMYYEKHKGLYPDMQKMVDKVRITNQMYEKQSLQEELKVIDELKTQLPKAEENQEQVQNLEDEQK